MNRLVPAFALLLSALPLTARAEDAPPTPPAQAQTQTQTQTQAQAQPAPAEAAPQDPAQDAKHRAALAHEVVKLFDLRALMSNVLTVTSKTLLPIILEANPGQDARIDPIVKDAVQKAILAHMDELEKNRAAVYAEFFTAPELEQLRDFYKSPAGQKMIKVTPDMMARSAVLDHDLMIDAVRAANKEIGRQLRKNGMKVPKDLGV